MNIVVDVTFLQLFDALMGFASFAVLCGILAYLLSR